MESNLSGVQLGPLIPVQGYDAVGKAIWARFPATGEGPSQHAVTATVGWMGLGYRARSAAEHIAALRPLFDREPSAPHEARYAQDNHFFGFVTNAAAAAESLVFAAHALTLGFQNIELTKSMLKRDRKGMTDAIAQLPLLQALGMYLGDAMRAAIPLYEMRDMLLHRGRPPRNHYAGGEFDGKMTLASNPKSPPGAWVNDFVFGPECCDPWEGWLRELIAEAIAHLDQALHLGDGE